MSGGGSSKKKTDTTKPAVTQEQFSARLPTMQTFQPTLPGFQGMLAQQLQQGFGSQGQDYAGLLSSLYKPMGILNFQEPISTTAAAWDAKKYAPISTGNPALDKLLMGGGKVTEDKKK